MNKRMTKRDTDGQAMMDCQKCEADWTGKHGKPMVDCTALYCRNRLKDRLAAYEDTRLTPERCAEFARADAEGRYIVMRDAEQEGVARLRELAEADKAGRLVVLPCKVGDTIYHISKVRTSHFEDDKIIIDDEGRWKIYEMPFTLIHLPYIGKSYFSPTRRRRKNWRR